MGRDMPAQMEETERLPWEMENYELRLIGKEEKPNKFYDPKPHIDNRTGNEVPGDSPLFEKNWSLKFEVVTGEKKGDWLFVNFISKYFRVKSDGKLVGKLAHIAHAINPDLDIKSTGIDIDEDLMHGFVRASVSPSEDGKYGNVTAWGKSKLSDVEKAAINGIKLTEVAPKADARPLADEPEIPFHHAERLLTVERVNGHAHHGFNRGTM